MAKKTVAEIPAQLYQILEPLKPDARRRVVRATMILLGEDYALLDLSSGGLARQESAVTRPVPAIETTAQAYLLSKRPKNKGEMLAIAARYRELNENAETHSRADLKKVISDAGLVFDGHNFGRDINNAKRQAGFFNTNTGRDSNKLSFFGQKYADALPDRLAAGKIKKSGSGSKG